MKPRIVLCIAALFSASGCAAPAREETGEALDTTFDTTFDTTLDVGRDAATDGDVDASDTAESGDGCTPVVASTTLEIPYRAVGDPASDALTRLDVHVPPAAGCGRAVLVWVHGGAWSFGDKANELTDKISWAFDRDAVLVSVNYRLTTAGGSVQHPDHVNDVAAAVRWVVDHAADYGGASDRVALLGHSAGAHLVALVVANPDFLAGVGLSAASIRAVGSFDTEYTVSEIIARDPRYEAVFTDDPAVWDDASPALHVRPGLPPFLLACRGSQSRVAQCETFAAALAAAGGEATTIDAGVLTHEEVSERIGAPGDGVMTPAVDAFLSAQGM